MWEVVISNEIALQPILSFLEQKCIFLEQPALISVKT